MKYVTLLVITLTLSSCAMFGKSPAPTADEQARCKVTYTVKEYCEADAACEWKVRSDGKEVCRAKQ